MKADVITLQPTCENIWKEYAPAARITVKSSSFELTNGFNGKEDRHARHLDDENISPRCGVTVTEGCKSYGHDSSCSLKTPAAFDEDNNVKEINSVPQRYGDKVISGSTETRSDDFGQTSSENAASGMTKSPKIAGSSPTKPKTTMIDAELSIMDDLVSSISALKLAPGLNAEDHQLTDSPNSDDDDSSDDENVAASEDDLIPRGPMMERHGEENRCHPYIRRTSGVNYQPNIPLHQFNTTRRATEEPPPRNIINSSVDTIGTRDLNIVAQIGAVGGGTRSEITNDATFDPCDTLYKLLTENAHLAPESGLFTNEISFPDLFDLHDPEPSQSRNGQGEPASSNSFDFHRSPSEGQQNLGQYQMNVQGGLKFSDDFQNSGRRQETNSHCHPSNLPLKMASPLAGDYNLGYDKHGTATPEQQSCGFGSNQMGEVWSTPRFRNPSSYSSSSSDSTASPHSSGADTSPCHPDGELDSTIAEMLGFGIHRNTSPISICADMISTCPDEYTASQLEEFNRIFQETKRNSELQDKMMAKENGPALTEDDARAISSPPFELPNAVRVSPAACLAGWIGGCDIPQLGYAPGRMISSKSYPTLASLSSSPLTARDVMKQNMCPKRQKKLWIQVQKTDLKSLVVPDKDGDTELMIAVSKENETPLECIYALVGRLKVDEPKALVARNNFQLSALYMAVVSNKALVAWYIAEVLIELDFDLNETYEGNGNTLVHCLTTLGDDYIQVMKHFLPLRTKDNSRMAFDINLKNNDGFTPLHLAHFLHGRKNVDHNKPISCLKIIQLLLDYGATNGTEDMGKEELHEGAPKLNTLKLN